MHNVLSSLRTIIRLSFPTPLNKKAVTAAKFLIAIILFATLLIFSSRINAQDFGLESLPGENNEQFSTETNISACSAITTAGVYTLTASVSNSGLRHCIRINVSDVVFDGQGFIIDGTDTAATFGIFVENRTASLTNITIINVTVSDWRNGIYINNTLSGTVTNTNVTSNTNGALVYNSINLTISNNTMSNNQFGIWFENVTNSNISTNNATSNTNTGIHFITVSNNTIYNNNASKNSQWGIRIRFSNNTLIDNNVANSNTNYGIELESSNYSTVTNNLANNQTIAGIFLNTGTNYANVTNNTANLNDVQGFFIQYLSRDNNFTNNTAQENGYYDFYIGAVSGSKEDCQNIYSNNVASGNRSFKYFNSSVDLRNDNVSEMVLCNADNSNLTNITIDGSLTKGNNWLHIIFTDNANITSIRSLNNYYGIYFDTSNNNTFHNSTLENNTKSGVYLTASTNYNLTNNTANKNIEYGIYLTTSSNNNITNNAAIINSQSGIYLDTGSNNNTLKNNVANNNSQVGISLASVQNNTIISNAANNNSQYGIGLISSVSGPDPVRANSNTIINNTANFNILYGIYIYSASNNSIINNTANWNVNTGIYITYATGYLGAILNSSTNQFINNYAEYNNYGIYFDTSEENTITNNTISSNTFIGIYLTASRNNTFINNTAKNNSYRDFMSAADSTKNTVTNLTIGPMISFTSTDIGLGNLTAPPSNPSGYQNIGKYVNVTNTSANSWIFLNISYTNADVSGINESNLSIARYDGALLGWVTNTTSFAAQNGVIASLNYVFANITGFGSPFAPFTSTDTTLPNSALLLPANDSIIAGNNISLNCSASDDVALSNISLFTTFDGLWATNRTVSVSGTSNQTNFTTQGISDGTYFWNCLAKDTSNNQAFNTTNYTITLDSTPPANLNLSAPEEAYSSTSTTVEFNFSATDNIDTNLTCNVTIDGSQVARINLSNGTFRTASSTVSVASHQWNVTCYDNVLNSRTSITRNFTITATASPTPTTTSGGGGGGGGGPIKPTPKPIPEEPEPEIKIIQEPVLLKQEIPSIQDILPGVEPILANAMLGAIGSLTPLPLELSGRRTEDGIELLFGSKGKIKFSTVPGGRKPKINIEFGNNEIELSVPQYSDSLLLVMTMTIMLWLLIVLVHGTVHLTFEKYAWGKLTDLQKFSIGRIQSIAESAKKHPNPEYLEKSMKVFIIYAANELNLESKTYKATLDAIKNKDLKFKAEIIQLYKEFSEKHGKPITIRELKALTNTMTWLIKKF